MSRRPALMLWCQFSLGLGHLMRSLNLARGLKDRFRVTLLCGGRIPGGLKPIAGVEIVRLPPIGDHGSGLVSLDGRRSTARALEVRRRVVLDVYRRLQPRVVLIEYWPFGRPHFREELEPLLEACRLPRNGRPLVLCSVRDLLKPEARFAPENEGIVETLNHYFDGVLVHSDPRLSRLEDSFVAQAALSVPVHYTGFVTPSSRPTSTGVRRGVLVSAGGGLPGGRLLRCALDAHRDFGLHDAASVTLAAGPYLSRPEWRALRAAAIGVRGLRLRRWLPDLRGAMESARVSVSHAGYNTVMDLLVSRVPALVVPFSGLGGQESEQSERCRRLESLGLLRVLDSERADPSTLACEVDRTLEFAPAPLELSFSGAEVTARLVLELVL